MKLITLQKAKIRWLGLGRHLLNNNKSNMHLWRIWKVNDTSHNSCQMLWYCDYKDTKCNMPWLAKSWAYVCPVCRSISKDCLDHCKLALAQMSTTYWMHQLKSELNQPEDLVHQTRKEPSLNFQTNKKPTQQTTLSHMLLDPT